MRRQKQLTEMGRAIQAIGSIRDCWLLQNPAGSWSYFGRIPAELCEWRKCHVASCTKVENGVPLRMSSKSYQTREDGVEHLATLGYAIYNDGQIVKPSETSSAKAEVA